ncbi:MAG: hypothetical protein IJK73_06105 [Bacteroidales bacterium]|nr:hypothetical protein [Bacteroidales bacterium]
MKARFSIACLLMLACFSFSALAQEEEKAPAKKYGFKSAIVKLSTDVMGQKITSTTYIDDFGAKECQKTKVSVPGAGEIEAATIMKDGKVWAVDYSSKKVLDMTGKTDTPPNFLELDEESVKKYELQEVGKETVLDKECTVYTMKEEVQGMKVDRKVWIYKGLMLKQETSAVGMKIKATVIELQEDAAVLPQVFDIPNFE